MPELLTPVATLRIWQVGALCRAIADALDTRFNPVAVRGEISGFSRAASGHCYFTLRDEAAQLRCAMFRRAASLLDFSPGDGELVELRGRLGIYEARGDLQLIVESMTRAGQGAWFEQFLRLKGRLEAEGLFDPARKRKPPLMPRAIGVVTSLGAAALHDVVTTLQRRVPNIPVLIAPAPVQGSSAPAAIVAALQQLYGLAQRGRLDVILLVRGGGSLEDLWAFNDEVLARAVFQSPVPLVSGVGHETDFTIVDFVADLRAPTPTAAAELVAEPRAVWMGALELLHGRLQDGVSARLDRCHQQLDLAVSRLGRPSARLARQRLELSTRAQRLRHAVTQVHARLLRDLTTFESALPRAGSRGLEVQAQRLERVSLRLQLLDPRLVLQRGYAWLSDLHGRAVTRADQTHAGQALQATLADGKVDLTVSNGCGN